MYLQFQCLNAKFIDAFKSQDQMRLKIGKELRTAKLRPKGLRCLRTKATR